MRTYHYNKAINEANVQDRISALDKLLVIDEIINLPKNILNQIREEQNEK